MSITGPHAPYVTVTTRGANAAPWPSVDASAAAGSTTSVRRSAPLTDWLTPEIVPSTPPAANPRNRQPCVGFPGSSVLHEDWPVTGRRELHDEIGLAVAVAVHVRVAGAPSAGRVLSHGQARPAVRPGAGAPPVRDEVAVAGALERVDPVDLGALGLRGMGGRRGGDDGGERDGDRHGPSEDGVHRSPWTESGPCDPGRVWHLGATTDGSSAAPVTEAAAL